MAHAARAGKDGESRLHRAVFRTLGAYRHAHQAGRRDGDRRDQPERRHQVAGRDQDGAHLHRCRRLHRKGQERRATPGRPASRRDRRHRRMAVIVHARGDRGHRARGNFVADIILRRQHHVARLQIRLPDVRHRHQAIGRRAADHYRSGQARDRQSPEPMPASSATIPRRRSPSSSRCARAASPMPA